MSPQNRSDPDLFEEPQRSEALTLDELAGRFRAAWSQQDDPATAAPELLPVRLARGCLAVLPVAGAGLSLMDGDFRVPLGASDEHASLAERLQFSQGEGPCLDAAREQRIQVADPAQLDQKWPQFAEALDEHTPYRAILALPLTLAGSTRGALDLFFTQPAELRAVRLADAMTVADRIVEALTLLGENVPVGDNAANELFDGAAPAWLLSPASLGRQTAWIAIGMLMTNESVTAPDALALLRAYAYGHNTLLDTVCADLVNGTLSVDEMHS